ncbi:MAG: hypothetical protein ACRDYV_02390 [Acidimicrobiia bacterium]
MTPQPRQDRCRSCGAPVLWVRMAGTGRWMPLDQDPDPRGTVYLAGGKGRTLAPGATPATGGPTYRSHFASCPDADHHRRMEASDRG